MISKSIWLVLCLCGLLVMLLGCGKKAKEGGLPMKENVPPPPSATANPSIPPKPTGQTTTTPAVTPAPVVTTPTGTSEGAPISDKPLTARQAQDKLKREGAPIEEIEELDPPE